MSVLNQPLCEKLRTARESRGLSLADVAHVTSIPVSRLSQLEEGNYAAFGSMAYARSFIRTYSKFLDVDADSVIEGLPEPVLGGADDYRHLSQSYGPWINKRSPQLAAHGRPGRRGSPAFTALVLTLILGTGLVVYASVYVFPGWVRKGQAASVPPSIAAPAFSKSMATGAKADGFKGGEYPTVFVDADHPNVPYRKATAVEDAPVVSPIAQ